MRNARSGIAAALLAASGMAAAVTYGEYQSYGVGGWADAVAVGDVTGDGRDDVVLTTAGNSGPDTHHVFVYVQQPDGSLAPPRKYAYDGATLNTGLALADMDRDGIKDIIVGHDGISIFSSDRRQRGHFRQRYSENAIPAFFIGVSDVDRDGLLDVIGPSWSGAVIYYGDGAGGIRAMAPLDPGRTSFTDLEVGDVNADGFEDLVVAYGQPPDDMGVYYHDGHAGYRPVLPLEFGAYPSGLAIGDFNDDGRLDVVGSVGNNHPYSWISIFYQRADGTLAPYFDMQSGNIPAAMIGADVSGDGRDDLIVSHDGWAAFGLYQQGLGGFGLLTERGFPMPNLSHLNKQGLATGDINSDGCADVVFANYNYGLVTFRGSGCPLRGDLAVAVSGGTGSVSVGLSSAANGAAIEAPLLEIVLSVRAGTLQTGTLPANCAIQAQTARSQRIECLVAALPAGSSTALTIPLQTSLSGFAASLEVIATARTDTPEWALANNTVRSKLGSQRIASSKTSAPVRRAGNP